MKKIHLFALSVLLFVSVLSLSVMGQAIVVSDVGTSARMLSIGHIGGVDSSAIAVFENPASLEPISRYSFSAFTSTLFGEVNYRNFAVAKKTAMGTLSLGYMSAGMDGFPESQKVMVDGTEKFIASSYHSISHSLVKMGHSYALSESVTLGSAVSFYSDTIMTVTGTGYNADLGLIYSQNRWKVSQSFQNLIRPLSLDYSNGASMSLPFYSMTSIQVDFSPVSLYSQVKYVSHSDPLFLSLGSRYTPHFLPFLEFNAGLRHVPYLDTTRTHATLGIGISLNGISFHYAYEESDVLNSNDNHYFSLDLSL